jgi:MoaA/NifB/PqqE/SkfB family radical SAM enzyme
MVSYSRYNEPLADRIILRRIEQARQRLPRALLHTNTNGDYLTPAYLDDLSVAGLRSLNIQIYLGNDDRYDHERMRAKLEETIDRLALVATPVIDDAGLWLESSARHRDIRIRLYARNFEVNGTDRGGTVPIQIGVRRTSPCLSPFYHVYIDFNGSVMPCCNLRSDVPGHADAVVTTLGPTSDLVSIYAGEVLAAWRRSLVGFGVKTGHCRSCTFATHPDTAESRRVHERLVAYASSKEIAA